MIAEQSVREFCDALAARTPSPGGGATAAVVGALGAAQLLMVAEYADWSGRDDPRPHLRRVVDDLLALADEDAEAYAAFRAAPKGDRAARERICAVPRDTTRVAESSLAVVEEVATAAATRFAVDVSIAASCLRACADGAAKLLEANS